MLAPGSLLLQQAIERRSQLNQHLTHLMLENSVLPAATDMHSGTQAVQHVSQEHTNQASMPVNYGIADPEHLQSHAYSRPGDAHFHFNNLLSPSQSECNMFLCL